MNSAIKRNSWLNQPSASGFLVSSVGNGILAILLGIACIILCLVPIPSDIARSTIESLLPVSLFLGGLSFFHYRKYVSMKIKAAEQGAAANP